MTVNTVDITDAAFPERSSDWADYEDACLASAPGIQRSPGFGAGISISAGAGDPDEGSGRVVDEQYGYVVTDTCP